jgi:hypothetical protein
VVRTFLDRRKTIDCDSHDLFQFRSRLRIYFCGGPKLLAEFQAKLMAQGFELEWKPDR